MSDHAHKSHFKEYMVIFAVLAVLTVVELYIPEIKGLSSFAKGSSLVVLAVAKAFCVGFWYMHLKDEKAMLKWIALIPLSAVAYTVALCLESLYR